MISEKNMKQINFYCDESCHIQNDGNPVMSLSAICCSKIRAKQFNSDIKTIKKKYGFNPNSEIKWNKVSNCNIIFYKEIIDYIANNSKIKTRIIIAKNKDKIVSNSEKGSYDDWYLKMYFYLMKRPVEIIEEYKLTEKYGLYIDRKDSHSVINYQKIGHYLSKKVKKNSFFAHSCDSKEHELIQVADILAGASTYYYRKEKNSMAKKELMEYIQERLNISFGKSSTFNNLTANVFIWNGRDHR